MPETTRRHFTRAPRRAGTIETIAGVRSPELGNTRDLHVYLPPGYAGSASRYPVAYMQDGQNLFDPELAFAAPWNAQVAADASARLGYPLIIVGIANLGAHRVDEYSPFADRRVGGGVGDRYLVFVRDRVKAMIDREYRTLPGREHTIIGGASMGGLIALYAYFRFPEVFGRACVQSPALWFAEGAFFDYVDAATYVPGRIFLDVGRREGVQTLYNARRLRDALHARGFVEGDSLRWIEDRVGAHDERAWGRRLKRALPFLLESRTLENGMRAP
ncbi:MAG TPA: alpha/beta hydrolase-fold protein [Gemmatimonadaceae bacterium]|nr:alpha/beta hydrolase-fold protein [Gemmatimonadaceae bacterium]